jgi:hypothetical protein
VAARVPSTNASLTDAVAFVLAHQHADGGFSYSTTASADSDVDDTAAFLAALHAAQGVGISPTGLNTAIGSAQAYLFSKQNADGGFLSDPAWGSDSNVSSTATALIALNSLGLASSAQAAKAATYLKGTQQTNGSFPYQLPVAQGQTGDTFDTVYAVAALAGKGWPQAVYDGAVPTVTPTPSPSVTPIPTATPVGSVLGASTTAGGSGAVLPSVGTFANGVLLAIAGFIALGAGLIVYLRPRSIRRAR